MNRKCPINWRKRDDVPFICLAFSVTSAIDADV
jgi:hypothetical protein